ncbi:MAG: hypothetical protein WCK02_08835 [Bacteroidota bacterium]
MDFFEFLMFTDKQDDKDLSSFILAFKKLETIPPRTSDPRILSRFLYRKLNLQETRGFKKWFRFYRDYDKENEIPIDLFYDIEFDSSINLIVSLQLSDPDYNKIQ